MIDPLSLPRIAQLHPKISSEVTPCMETLVAKGISIRVTQGLRSFSEQDAIYAKGRTTLSDISCVHVNGPRKPGTCPEHPLGATVTNAKAGESYHNYGLALDFALLHKDGSVSWKMNEDSNHNNTADWMEVIVAFGKAGFNSGLYWKHPDTPHLEKTFGLSIQQCLDKYHNHQFGLAGYILI